MNNPEPQAIDPARLADGKWCHRTQNAIGQGDISASYSADRIGMGQPVRRPFVWKGAPHVCVSKRRYESGGTQAEAYRLVHPDAFDGEPLSYGEKTANADAARADPSGFYHGMLVKHAGTLLVLCGPPLVFVPGLSEQLSLF
tara:strand:+ start:83 stop:508 length:426 start_codon:yes stop_codon:yes gene_type:complete